MALEFTDANFQKTVIDSDKLSVIDFWAEWYGGQLVLLLQNGVAPAVQ